MEVIITNDAKIFPGAERIGIATLHSIVLIHPPFYDMDTENSLLKPLFTNRDPDIEIKSFSWKLALLSSYKVLHVHWLEHLVAAPTIPKSLCKALLSMFLLCRVSISNIRVVNTRHNLKPHSKINNPFSRVIYYLWEKKVSTQIVMNRFELTNLEPTRRLIPHPVYTIENFGISGALPQTGTERQYYIHFGRMDANRFIVDLIQNFGTSVKNANLLLVGEVPKNEYRSKILSTVKGFSNVYIVPKKISLTELNSLIHNSSGVIGPLNDYHNSGVLFHALSHKKSILTLENATSRELQSELAGSLINLDIDPCSRSAILRFVSATSGSTLSQSIESFISQRQPIDFFRKHIALYKEIIKGDSNNGSWISEIKPNT